MNSFFSHQSISEVLVFELDARKRRNDSYSLRSFARDLDLSPSRLSEVLKGAHGLSEKSAITIAKKLKLKPAQEKFWYDLVLSECSRSQKVRALALQRITASRKTETLNELKESQFRAIADWHHTAILELTQVNGFQKDFSWIAKQLGITLHQATDAIERLQGLRLLEIKNDQWIVNSEAYQAFSEVPSTAIRKFHRQVLQNGIESLLNDPMQARAIQSMMVAIPRERLPEFDQKFKNFLLQFWEDLEGAEKSELYSLSLQLVPVRRQ